MVEKELTWGLSAIPAISNGTLITNGDGAELFKQQAVDIGTEKVTDHQAEGRRRVGCGI